MKNKLFGILVMSMFLISMFPIVATTASDLPPVLLVDNVNFQDSLVVIKAKPVKPPTGGGSTSQVVDWGYARINAAGARAAASGTVVVAVLDTGVDAAHADLAGVVVACFSGISRADYSCDNRNVKDDDGHGTHVAGTIAALDNSQDSVGAAAGHVEIINGKVLGRRGGGWDDLAWAIRHATDLGADVITMSLGGDISSSPSTQALLQGAIDYAIGNGVAVLAAAGNEGTCAAGDVQHSWPAENDGVFTVGATGIYANGAFVTTWTGAEEDVMPCFSNEMPAGVVDVSAPGVYITALAKGGGTTEMSGTSMATPYTAAMVANLMAAGMSANQAFSYLTSHTVDMGYPSTMQGAGLIVY